MCLRVLTTKVLKTLIPLLLTVALHGQVSPTLPADTAPRPGLSTDPGTADLKAPFEPLPIRHKFTIAFKDAFDATSFLFSSVNAATSQIDNTNPSFGQGAKGFAHRYGTAMLDQTSATIMTRGVLPVLFHQDPRYFRKGEGTIVKRALWATSRVFVTRNDQGNWTLNTSGLLGNGMVAAMGNAYYPDARGFDPTMQRILSRLTNDILTRLFREFLPDAKKLLERRKHRSSTPKK